jgi:hypothetical protein
MSEERCVVDHEGVNPMTLQHEGLERLSEVSRIRKLIR